MNERIKELVGRAEAYAYEHEEHWHDGPDWQELFNKKFALLIVQECGKYLESEAERLYALSAQESNPNFQSNFEICAEKCYDNIQGLKEHFGVEIGE